jgi:hypothetical protein
VVETAATATAIVFLPSATGGAGGGRAGGSRNLAEHGWGQAHREFLIPFSERS